MEKSTGWSTVRYIYIYLAFIRYIKPEEYTNKRGRKDIAKRTKYDTSAITPKERSIIVKITHITDITQYEWK